MMILVYSFIFTLFTGWIDCDTWKDPNDMFEIFKTNEDPDVIKADLKSVELFESTSVTKCPQETLSVNCHSMLDNLLGTISTQLPVELEEKDQKVTLQFLLTRSDIEKIRLLSSQMKRLQLCSVIQDSLIRGSEHPSLNSTLRYLMNMVNSFVEQILNLLYRLKVSFQLKEFIILQVFMMFLSSVFILFKFRSISLLIVWVILCCLFLSLYTSYEHLYQMAVAKREADIAHMGVKIPSHCHHMTRGFFESWIHGTRGCKEFFIAHNVQPEVEVRMTDILVNVVTNLWTGFVVDSILASDRVSQKITGDSLFGFLARPFVFILALVFFIICMAFCVGIHFSAFGLSFSVGQRNRPIEQTHRQVVQTVEPPEPVQRIEENAAPSVSLPPEWLHNLLELREKSVAEKTLRDSSRLRSSVEQEVENHTTSSRHLHRLKSTGVLKRQTTTELIPLHHARRLSL